MGLASPTAPKADSFRERDALVTACAYAAGAAAAAVAVAIGVALIAYGWNEVAWVLSAPSPQGVLRALGTTALIVVIALPMTFVAGIFAAGSANDPNIGGLASKALRESIEWSSRTPPVVVGVAVFFCAIALHTQNALVMATFALVVLNVPNATARFALAFGAVPRQACEAAAALGASSTASFFGLVLPSSVWGVAAALFAVTAQMVGETTAIAIAISTSNGPQPLSVQIWHFASNRSLAGTEAAACVVLVAIIVVFLALSRACLRRGVEAVSLPP
ncbi:MAG TPA: ABC transporter permease subunit [Candidatus Acidoferrales bacterium]|nr:ABC transporter permease subunit [Candidatus Acidoferrales bacterium]